ncbi:hypothetical protein ALC56_02257 [Trachymyrmex septentrionalis]|uniref:Uncharacterized protein n=1 Tax=Trachymyrmex septentrionalis TaxID=34720 RepID=A0A195FTU3_9HYME|nr:hypothetical protein ALC56_02257 [Trachymyrmex septentrionalis]
MRGPSLPRQEHKSEINSVRRKSGDFKKSLYTPVGPSAKKYRGGRPPPPPPPQPSPPPLVYHVPHNICHAIRVLHTRYIPFGREDRERERERKEKKDEANRKSSGNEALSFSSEASPISLTSADLPAYYPACVRECVYVNNKRAREGSSPLIEVAAKYFRGNESRDRKGEIALLPTVNVREQAAAPGTVCRARPPSSAVSLPLGFCREGRQTHVKESEREFPFAAYVAAGRTL